MSAVSIIIPAYGHAEYILQTLESIFAQTFTDYEIIVVNDGSPDHTAEVLRPLVKSGEIRYFEQSNQGVAAARNFGWRQANGDFIAFLDDDDCWPEDKLEWQVSALREDEKLGLIGGAWAPLGGSNTVIVSLEPWRTDLKLGDLFTGNPFISPGQMLIRRSVLEKIGGFDAKIWGTDDLDLLMRATRCSKAKVIPRLSLYYRHHAGNASKCLPRMIRNFRCVIRKNLPFIPAPLRYAIEEESWLWLYSWTGLLIIRKMKCDLHSCRIVSICTGLFRLLPFFVASCRYPKLRSKLSSDLLPGRWKIECINKAY